MIDHRRGDSPMSRGAAPTALGLMGLILAILLAACGPSSGTSRPNGAPASNPAASPSAEASAPASQAASGQTDTAWGRIWDSLPTGFPTYPGSTPADEASTGPASATLAVDGDAAKAVGNWMAAELEKASYKTDELSGPFEDGSYVLQSLGTPAGCRVQVTAVPLGSLTTVTIMYGAACPHA